MVPVQQSVGWLQASPSPWHCSLQVLVAALQNPAQHSKSMAQVAPVARHAVGRHSPASQRPAQQSFDVAQGPPAAPQVGSRQRPPAQAEPAQQAVAEAQVRPGAAQLPSPAAQVPATHCFEQHTDDVRQDSPPGAQPQVPSLRH